MRLEGSPGAPEFTLITFPGYYGSAEMLLITTACCLRVVWDSVGCKLFLQSVIISNLRQISSLDVTAYY